MRHISKFVLSCFVICGSVAQAHRPTISAQEAKAWGLRPVKVQERLMGVSKKTPIPYEAHSLNLPIPLLAENPLGGNMHQLQDYTQPDYYHAGLDLRAQINEPVIAPVGGVVEAGYYAYEDNPDGSTTKLWLSYQDAVAGVGKPPWGDLYFELAVIDEHGFRFEFHHVDADLLTSEIIQKIKDRGYVHKGQEVAKVIKWRGTNQGLSYHHLHYNIIAPNGILVNPLYVSEKMKDVTPPDITFVYSANGKKCGENSYALDRIELEKEAHGFIVVETRDTNVGKTYATPPTRLKATFGSQVWDWDFSKTLTHPITGALPDLRDYYLQYYCAGVSSNIRSRASMSYRFYIKIPVPSLYNGPVLIEAIDMYGNSTSKTVNVKTPSI